MKTDSGLLKLAIKTLKRLENQYAEDDNQYSESEFEMEVGQAMDILDDLLKELESEE